MKADIVLVPYDSGHAHKRMGLGPRHIFESGLKDLFRRAGTQFECEEISVDNPHPAEINVAFESCQKIATRVRQSRANGAFPVVLSGNCMSAVGTVSGCGADNSGVVWFDAHGESTTPETTKSGFLDGMPISTLLGRAWQALSKTVPGFTPVRGDRILLFGAHELELAERDLLTSAGVLEASTIDQLTKHLGTITAQVESVYVHVDLDVLDASVATANQWSSPGGITLETLLESVIQIRTRAKVSALGIASYDPATDSDGRALSAALQVVQAVLGFTI